MARRTRRHLHTQIVVPLIAASLLLGAIAGAAGLAILSGVVRDWIDASARSAADSAAFGMQRLVVGLERAATTAAEDSQLTAAVHSGDGGAVERHLGLLAAVAGADDAALIDDDGRRVVSVTPAGSTAVPELADDAAAGLVPAGDRYLLRAVHPLTETTLTVAFARHLDGASVAGLINGGSVALCIADSSGRVVARDLSTAAEEDPFASMLQESGGYLDPALYAETARSRAIVLSGREYRVVASELTFGGNGSPTGYAVAAVGTDVLAHARNATLGIVGLWSLAAIGALLGVNWYVGRNASKPLAEISADVSRVAEGDFAVRMREEGDNEIAELAASLNRMTDSLRDRSESLTRKVLELATLYEMSRTLGSTLDRDTLLDSVLDSVIRIFNVEYGCVSLLDPEDRSVRVRNTRGVGPERPDEAAVRSSMSEWVVREGRPLIFNPPREDEARTDDGSTTFAALCVPLLGADATHGAIMVASRDPDHRFTGDDVRLLGTIANQLTVAIGNIELFSSLQEAYLATVRALAAAVDAKDPYTRGHSEDVARFALLIADAMSLSPDQRIALEMAGYLHDIGKIGIAEDILHKPGALSETEMGQMRHHPLIGASILKPVAFPWPIAPVVRHHHEHYDGRGYPAGLQGEEIPLLARILTVADAFEAMVSDRPYRQGRSQSEAIIELRRCAGTQFDSHVVDVLIDALSELDEELGPTAEDVAIEVDDGQTRAAFVAVCDGVFASFRRLGGPRLAANLEAQINVRFESEDLPFRLHGGHLVDESERSGDAEFDVESLRVAFVLICEQIGQTSGSSLVDNFFLEAMEALPERMRACAIHLGIDEGRRPS